MLPPLQFSDEEKALLRWLVDELPPVEQAVINGLFYEGVSLDVLCRRLDIDHRSTVMRIRNRALEKLGQVLMALKDDEED